MHQNHTRIECPGCRVEVTEETKIPREGLCVSRVIYTTEPIDRGLFCGHNLNGQFSLF